MDKQWREEMMRHALFQAEKARDLGEVPVGCVVVKDGAVIGAGYNRRECDGDATAHAETIAIQNACKTLGTWRLSGCHLFVTLEPCPMCAGAILNARVESICFGAKDDIGGACGSMFNLFSENVPHKPRIYGGILAQECKTMLTNFFKTLREKED